MIGNCGFVLEISLASPDTAVVRAEVVRAESDQFHHASLKLVFQFDESAYFDRANGVKSAGCEKRIAQLSPMKSWKSISPWVLWASNWAQLSLGVVVVVLWLGLHSDVGRVHRGVAIERDENEIVAAKSLWIGKESRSCG